MSLDPTAREANFLDSVKKFFIDNLYTISSIPVLFDNGLNEPNIRAGGSDQVDKWVSVNHGNVKYGNVSEKQIRIYICHRRDKEGFRLAQLSDTVMGYLTDIAQNDGHRRMTLYKSHVDPNKWTSIGGVVIYVDVVSQQMQLNDETKYKIIECTFRWGTKI